MFAPVKWFHTKQQWLAFYRSSNAEFVAARTFAPRAIEIRSTQPKAPIQLPKIE